MICFCAMGPLLEIDCVHPLWYMADYYFTGEHCPAWLDAAIETCPEWLGGVACQDLPADTRQKVCHEWKTNQECYTSTQRHHDVFQGFQKQCGSHGKVHLPSHACAVLLRTFCEQPPALCVCVHKFLHKCLKGGPALKTLCCADEVCDDSKCTSIGNDCYAPGNEAKTCAPGYHVKQHSAEHYTCCTSGSVECIQHGGLERCWRTYVPHKLSSPVRVVMDLHGYSNNMMQTELYTGWRQIAEAEGVVVVWPQGTAALAGQPDPNSSWNAGSCCGAASDKAAGIDDVGFLRKAAEAVAAAHGADVSRHVYWAGHSNGCAMAQRMAAQANDVVAAVGCHAAYLLLEDDQMPTADSYGTKPVPVIHVHGTADGVVGYEGFPYPSSPFNAMNNLARWATLNGCPSPSAPKHHEVGNELKFLWHEGCAGSTEVELITLPGVGHSPYKGFDTRVATTQVSH